MSVGANIKKFRLQQHMSQQELAGIMGYKTRSTIAKIESGENDVSQSKLRKFAAALNTTVEELILNGEPSPSPSQMPIPQPERSERNIAVILAGGDDNRNNYDIPMQFVNISGKPMIVYCLEVYQSHPAVDEIYVVCLKGWESIVRAYARQYHITKLQQIITGGTSGMDSLKNAVDRLKTRYVPSDVVIIQEATRPLVRPETVSKLLLACSEKGSATICHAMDAYVQFHMVQGKARMADRNSMLAMQSPEAHRLRLITEVFDRTQLHMLQESCFTMLLYRLGYPINFVEGVTNNTKISGEEDIAAFAALAGIRE